MNILFIHEVDWLAKVVFDVHFLAEALSCRGHQVLAIDYEDTWHRDGIFDLGSLKTKKLDKISRAIDGSSVSLRRPGFIKIPGLSRLSAAFTHWQEIKKTIIEKDIDAIILYSVPTNGLQAVRLAKKLNIPILFRSIDILHMMVPYAGLRPLTRFLEKKVYSEVDMVLPNTPQYSKYIASMGVPDSRVKYLPFPLDTDLFSPSADASKVRQQWGLDKNNPVVVFIGTLFEFSGLDDFIRHFPRVIHEVPGVKLLIVGDGPQRPKLEEIIAELGLEKHVIITGFQPYLTMPQYINLATVCINTFVKNNDTKNVFPAKIMQYVACGKATVATALPGIMTLLPGESHGVVYAEDASGMVKEVVYLLKSEERRRELERNGLNQTIENYSYENVTFKLENILEEAIEKKRHGKN